LEVDMSWNEPGRADRVTIVPERGAKRVYARGEGDDDDQTWYEATEYPSFQVFRSGLTMTSEELIDVLRASIEG
jgi:hypothetical protein